MIIYQIIKPGANVVSGGLWMTSTIILTDFIMILVYIISADMPIQQVKSFLKHKKAFITNKVKKVKKNRFGYSEKKLSGLRTQTCKPI